MFSGTNVFFSGTNTSEFWDKFWDISEVLNKKENIFSLFIFLAFLYRRKFISSVIFFKIIFKIYNHDFPGNLILFIHAFCCLFFSPFDNILSEVLQYSFVYLCLKRGNSKYNSIIILSYLSLNRL